MKLSIEIKFSTKKRFYLGFSNWGQEVKLTYSGTLKPPRHLNICSEPGDTHDEIHRGVVSYITNCIPGFKR